MKFKYKSYGNALRPVIPVTILHNDAYIDYEVLIAYEEYKYTYFPDYALL